MGKRVHNDVLDAAFDEIIDNATLMIACSDEPADRAEAVGSMLLAQVAVSSGDFTVGDGLVSGRKLLVEQKTSTITNDGLHTHTAIVDGTRLLYVTTAPESIPLTAGNDIVFLEWNIELRDPT